MIPGTMTRALAVQVIPVLEALLAEELMTPPRHDGKVDTVSLTNRYDAGNCNHTMTCTRSACEGRPAHQAGRHLDQRSEFYDGPSGALGVASIYIRDSARKIVRDAPALMPEVMDLVTYCEFMRDQVAHASVDRDRGIRDAMARSESCEHHGEEIKALGEQVSAIDASAQKNEKARLALLGFLTAVDDLVEAHRTGRAEGLTVDKMMAALARASKKAHAAHTRAWS